VDEKTNVSTSKFINLSSIL